MLMPAEISIKKPGESDFTTYRLVSGNYVTGIGYPSWRKIE